MLDEPKGWSDQLSLRRVREGEAWARPRRKRKSLLIPLEKSKDLATVGSSYLSEKYQVTGDQGRRGKDDEEDRDLWLRHEVQLDKLQNKRSPQKKALTSELIKQVKRKRQRQNRSSEDRTQPLTTAKSRPVSGWSHK